VVIRATSEEMALNWDLNDEKEEAAKRSGGRVFPAKGDHLCGGLEVETRVAYRGTETRPGELNVNGGRERG